MEKKKKKSRDTEVELAKMATNIARGKPIVAALQAAAIAVRKLREHKFEKMWEHVVSGVDDPVAFTNWVTERLFKHGDTVADGFSAAAQAAAEATSMSPIASIGLLARRYLQTDGKEPSRREYRAILGILRSLDDVEFGAVRDIVHKLASVGTDPIQTLIQRDPNRGNQFVWFVPETGPSGALIVGDSAPELAKLLEPVANELIPGAEMVVGPKPSQPRYRARLVRILADIMPAPASF
jgi:hypothetical protein